MNVRLSRTAIGVLAGALLPLCPAFGAAPAKVSGSIAGLVSDSAGIPQIGASVLLYNRFDSLLFRTLTSDKGTFGFDSLKPDVYTVRVSLASFLPALKRNIVVQPGMQSMLSVNLANVFSSIELVAIAPGQSSIMSDDWRWVLRSAASTRPVLRLFPELKKPKSEKAVASVFSDTRGVVKVSAGDQTASGLGTEADLGTSFAFATSFLGSNQLQVSGNVGRSGDSALPVAGFRTSFRRDLGGGMSTPEVKVTMRQLSLPMRGAQVMSGESPVLRTLSATMLDAVQLTGDLRLEYGTSIDSVQYLDRLNYVSPYGRLIYNNGNGDTVQLGYASGTPPPEAFASEHETDLELQQDLSALALFPRVSLRSGAARVQRTQTLEAGYSKAIGSRTYAAAVYSDRVANAAVTLAGPGEAVAHMEVLSDLLANSWTANVGNYRSQGYMLSITQTAGSHFDMALVYGSGAALTAIRNSLQAGTLEDLRSAIDTRRRQSLTIRVTGTAPQAGTQFAASYQWANIAALNPGHMYLTERVREGQGLNIRVQQPLPYVGGLPGHLAATAEMRNLLAQGYAPLSYNGRRIFLMQTPRSVRGGLSFNF